MTEHDSYKTYIEMTDCLSIEDYMPELKGKMRHNPHGSKPDFITNDGKIGIEVTNPGLKEQHIAMRLHHLLHHSNLQWFHNNLQHRAKGGTYYFINHNKLVSYASDIGFHFTIYQKNTLDVDSDYYCDYSQIPNPSKFMFIGSSTYGTTCRFTVQVIDMINNKIEKYSDVKQFDNLCLYVCPLSVFEEEMIVKHAKLCAKMDTCAFDTFILDFKDHAVIISNKGQSVVVKSKSERTGSKQSEQY